ncbi:N-formylglutamate deformylase [Paraburkholderia sp. UCT70]|uniref:N-formylglutamate amidohydrolase n=1 Tax=Paraburkholderia sp. UCT70 TaxID=2991068 RepID=UPI003D1F32B9
MAKYSFATVECGESPLLLVMPHAARNVPHELIGSPNWLTVQGSISDPAAEALCDVATTLDATLVGGMFHPHVIDLHADADDADLTPHFSRLNLSTFRAADGASLYDTEAQYEDEVSRKVGAYWRPFHQSLCDELGRLKSSHDRVLMLVVHARQRLRNAQESVAFADCTVSTNFGRSADSRLVHALTSQVLSSGYSWVLNPAGAGEASHHADMAIRGMACT